ncbi:MAG: L-2-amino-thiazoline-4-carboxylic acid hydrolase [Candidatus Thorarchaeota archaeon]
MSSDNPKWKKKMSVTYEQYVHDIHAPRIQLAREFEKALGKEKTHEIIKSMSERNGAEFARKVGERERFESMAEYLAYTKKVYGSEYYSHVLTGKWKEAPNEYWFTCTECLNAKVFRDMDAADLGYIMLCNIDFAMTSAFHQKLRLERTKTLMEGDECCNFHCTWEDDV